MNKSSKLGALLGFAALAVALLGIALFLGEPATAGDDDDSSSAPVEKDTQGLMSSGLGL